MSMCECERVSRVQPLDANAYHFKHSVCTRVNRITCTRESCAVGCECVETITQRQESCPLNRNRINCARVKMHSNG